MTFFNDTLSVLISRRLVLRTSCLTSTRMEKKGKIDSIALAIHQVDLISDLRSSLPLETRMELFDFREELRDI